MEGWTGVMEEANTLDAIMNLPPSGKVFRRHDAATNNARQTPPRKVYRMAYAFDPQQPHG